MRPDVIETKLDAGQHILWTERGHDSILVWFVAKHKSVPHCVDMITRSYDRLASISASVLASASALASHEKHELVIEVIVHEKEEQEYHQHQLQQHQWYGAADDPDEVEPEVLCDPSANVPVKMHTVYRTALAQLATDPSCTPPLKLTAREEEIIGRDGSVLLLGCSGTGKTLCVCNRMARDRHHHRGPGPGTQPPLRQLFVAKTQQLCDYVQVLQQGSGEDTQGARFERMESLASARGVGGGGDGGGGGGDGRSVGHWSDRTRVDYHRFRELIWSEITAADKYVREGRLGPLLVWTQIRSFIKGSVEAVLQGGGRWMRSSTSKR